MPLLCISDLFVVITEVGTLVVSIECGMIWPKSILMLSEVRLKILKEFCHVK